MIRIIVVDDHSVVRTGICRLIETANGMEVVAEGEGGHEAVRLCREIEPDVVVLDYGLPDLDGLETTQQLVRLDRPPKILILTMHASEEYATRLIRAGANDFVIKPAPVEQVIEAIRQVARGQRYVSPPVMEKMLGRLVDPSADAPESVLSDREVQVLIRLAQGMTTREVADQLNLSVSTIDTYRRRILEKLDLRNNADMTRFAIKRRLIHLE